MQKILSVLLTVAVLAPAQAATTATPPAMASAMPDLSSANIQAMTALPVQSLQAVQTEQRLLFLSENGRYVIDGTLYDTWSRESLTSVSAIQAATQRIDLAGLGLNLDDLLTFTLGNGEQEVVVFVDPRCPHCHHLLQEASKLVESYRFVIVPIPVLGASSEEDVRRLACASDSDAALQQLLTGDFSALPQQTHCSLGKLQRTLISAQLLGVEGVPFVIAPDGRVTRGRPANLGAWLTTPTQER